MQPDDWRDAPEPAPAGASNQALLVALVALAAVLVVVVSAYLLVVVPRQEAAEREARLRLAERAPLVRRAEPSPEPVAVLPEARPGAPLDGVAVGADVDGPPADPRADVESDLGGSARQEAERSGRELIEQFRDRERSTPSRPTDTRPADARPAPPPARPGSPEATADTYLARMAGRSLPTMLGMYASRVRYYDRGVVGQDAIERDKEAYARRWPERRYTRTSAVTSRPGPDGTRTLRFDYDFVVRGGDRERSGRAWTELDVEPFESDFLIRGERGSTY